MVVMPSDFKPRVSGFRIQLCSLVIYALVLNFLTFWCFIFLIYKMGMIIIPFS